MAYADDFLLIARALPAASSGGLDKFQSDQSKKIRSMNGKLSTWEVLRTLYCGHIPLISVINFLLCETLNSLGRKKQKLCKETDARAAAGNCFFIVMKVLIPWVEDKKKKQ